jgi:pSer/pThr/pTyr-binding forkhead associated (FHA) protein
MRLRFIALATEGTLMGSGLDRLVDGDELIAGRERGVELLLPDISVSRRHFAVRAESEGWTIEDLSSRQGTAVNGMRLAPGLAVPLRVGDEIRAGAYKVVFMGVEQAVDNQGSRGILGVLSGLTDGDRDDQQLPCLRVQNGPLAGSCYLVRTGEELRLGRSDECELILDDAMVSRMHGLVSYRHGQLSYLDIGSSNGSLVDGKKAFGPVEIRDGTIIKLGRIRVACEDRERGRRKWLAALSAAGLGRAPSIVLPLAGLLLGLGGLLVILAL